MHSPRAKKVKRSEYGKRFTDPSKYRRKENKLTENKFLTDDEYQQLLKNIDALKPLKKQTRNICLILTAITTGARANEILNLRKQDLLSGNRVFIRGLKKSNDRTLPVPPEVFDRLKIEAVKSVNEFIFHVSYHQFWRIWHTVSPVPKKLHATRHTFAMRLYARVKNIFMVQYALGHRTPKNTMVYLHFFENEKTINQILDPDFKLGS